MEPTTGSEATAAVALVADMIFASRVRGAATAVGVHAVTVSRADRLLAEAARLRPGVVLVDVEVRGVDAPALIAALKEHPETADLPVVAFGSHVNAEALRAAREAGADRVLARSGLVRELPALLGGSGPASR